MAGLSIRLSQLEVLEQHAAATFAARLLAHLREELPAEWQGVPEADGISRCLELMRRAQSLGFTSIAAVARFAEVATLTEAGFGFSPRHAPALHLLEDLDLARSWPRERGLVVAMALLHKSHPERPA